MVSDTVPPNCDAENVSHVRPTDPAVAAEFDSFIAMLPQLRESHVGEYVAVRGGQVIAFGVYLDPVLKAAKVAPDPFFCGWVEPTEGYVFRFGSPTLLSDTSAQ